MNVSVEAPRTHHSTQQGQAFRAPPLVRPGTRPSQRLLPATRRALQPPMAPIPTPKARTIMYPPEPAAPIDLNALGAASHAPAVAGSHDDARYPLQLRLA